MQVNTKVMGKYLSILRTFFLGFIFMCMGFFYAHAQPRLMQQEIKASGIRQDGFSLLFETDVPSSYIIHLQCIYGNQEKIVYQNKKGKSTLHEFVLNDVPPSSIYKTALKIFDAHKDTLYYKRHYATASRAPGRIKTYFNHTVDHTYAIDNPAINVAHHMRDTLIAYINRAEETLDIAIYNSHATDPYSGISGAINAAHNRGVMVRVIYHGGTSSTMVSNLDGQIAVYARPTGYMLGLMHHKFIVADAHHQDAGKAWVWTGSTNWTNNQINGPDKNNVIIIYDQTLALTYTIEFEEIWGSNGPLPNPSNSRYGASKLDNTPKEFMIDSIYVECYFSPSDNTEQQILKLINDAQDNIAVATMLITRETLANALINRFNTGLHNFAILLDNQNPTGSQKPYLTNSLPPAHIKEFTGPGIMHHKMMVVDNGHATAAVLTGSHNWSASAELRNDENTLIIFDPSIANQYYQAAAALYSEAGGGMSVFEENTNRLSVHVYPNPAHHFLHLISNKEIEGVVKMHNLKGKLVLKKNIHVSFNKPEKINIMDVKAGIYFLQLKTHDENFTTKIAIF